MRVIHDILIFFPTAQAHTLRYPNRIIRKRPAALYPSIVENMNPLPRCRVSCPTDATAADLAKLKVPQSSSIFHSISSHAWSTN